MGKVFQCKPDDLKSASRTICNLHASAMPTAHGGIGGRDRRLTWMLSGQVLYRMWHKRDIEGEILLQQGLARDELFSGLQEHVHTH